MMPRLAFELRHSSKSQQFLPNDKMPTKAAVPGKRKQTEEMDTSPPKRVTRARSAKVSTQSTEPISKSTTKAKSTAASSKTSTAATKKKTGPPPKATAPAKTMRKTRAKDDALVEDEAVEEVPEAKDEGEPQVDGDVLEQKTTRPQAAKAIETEPIPSAPKSKRAQPKVFVRQSAKDEARTTRSRPKRGAAVGEQQEATQEPEAATEIPSESEPVKKTTRGRAAATSARATTKAAAAKATGATKKKVQFEDEHDKENIPIEVKSGPKKSAMKVTGMKAKPVRKATATRATTRGKKAIEQTKKTSPAKAKSMPLSPKKVDQVAKTSSGSEDELAGGKYPVRAMSRSPIKTLKSATKLPESSDKSALDEEVVPSSPTRLITMNMNASPARRPPQSPFKDGMKCSPIKGMFSPTKRPELSTSQVLSPSKHSLLRESPKKGLAIADATYSDLEVSKAVSSNKTSLLQESPRKGRLGETFKTINLAPSQSSLKGSLLQSPARRPTSSPFKSLAKSSPIKSKIGEAGTQASHTPADLTLVDSKRADTPHTDLPPSETRETSIEEPGVPLYQAESETPASPALASSPEDLQVSDDIDLFAPLDQEQGQQFTNSDSPTTTRDGEGAELQEAPTPMDIGDDPMDTSEDVTSAHLNMVAAPLPMSSMSWRRISGTSQLSEDELASPDKKYAPTPLRRTLTGTPHASDTPDLFQNDMSFGCLVDGMNSWTASSPDKKRPSRQQRGIFSLAAGHIPAVPEPTDAGGLDADAILDEAAKQSFFEEDPLVMNAGNTSLMAETEVEESHDVDLLKASMESQASQEYGDENVLPEEAELLRREQDDPEVTITCTPAKLVNGPREVCTVSKVPLRPSSEDSPLKVPRKRSKSLGGALAVLTENPDNGHVVLEQPATPQLASTIPPQTPSSGLKLDRETPRRSGRRSAEASKVLKGAIVYVDVHTTEGADASGIFVDLLTQIGARCVKQWNWQPGAELNDSPDGSTSPSGSPMGGTVPAGKVGITHVVYKDGGKRTLEKVRMANGVVLCVGVGWVLE